MTSDHEHMEQRLLDATERAVQATSHAAAQAERLRVAIEADQQSQRREYVERLLVSVLVVLLVIPAIYLLADHHAFGCESDAGPTTPAAAFLCDVQVPLHSHGAPGETRIIDQLCEREAIDERTCEVLAEGDVPTPIVDDATHAIARALGVALYAALGALVWFSYPKVRRRIVRRIEREELEHDHRD